MGKIGPLPLLIGKPVGRTESTASISKATTIPLQAKRFPAQAVEIRKPVKHSSLPTGAELPNIPNQSSLIMELSRWVLPSNGEGDQSSDISNTHSAFMDSSLVTQSPSALTPENPRSVVSVQSMTTRSAPATPMATGNMMPSPLRYNAGTQLSKSTSGILTSSYNKEATPTEAPATSLVSNSSSSSVRSESSISRKPAVSHTLTEEPAQMKPKDAMHKPQVIPNMQPPMDATNKSQPKGSDPAMLMSESTSQDGEAATADQIRPVAQALELATGVKSPAPSQNTWSPKTKLPSPTATAADANVSTPAPPTRRAPLPPVSTVTTAAARINGSSVPDPNSPAANAPIPTSASSNSSPVHNLETAPKPMTAQARRRAAHARRMQLAYEGA